MKTILRAVLALGLLTALAAPAAAQSPSLSSDPANVDAAGSHDLTVTGTDFTDDGFLLACPGANGDPAQLAEDSCDVANLTPYTAGDWEHTVTYDVAAEGLLIVAGNAAQTEVVTLVITVGDGADLPNTGANTNLYLTIGLAMAAGAAALVLGGRRLQRV